MEQLALLDGTRFVVFVLVLARVGGMVMTAPVFAAKEIPVRVRVLIALALALMIAPGQAQRPVETGPTLIDFVLAVGGELLVGVVLGLGLSILMGGLQLAGQMISQMSGIALADVFNPTFDANVPLFSELLYLCSLAVFLAIGGHRQVVEALLETYQSLPVGTGPPVDTVGQAAVAVMSQAMSLSLRVSAPTVAAQLVATVVLGLISRTLPQLNVLAMGFGVNSLVTFGTMWLSLGAMLWAFEADLAPVLASLLDALRLPT